MKQLEIPFTWKKLSEEEIEKADFQYTFASDVALVDLETLHPKYTGNFDWCISILTGNNTNLLKQPNPWKFQMVKNRKSHRYLDCRWTIVTRCWGNLPVLHFWDYIHAIKFLRLHSGEGYESIFILIENPHYAGK